MHPQHERKKWSPPAASDQVTSTEEGEVSVAEACRLPEAAAEFTPIQPSKSVRAGFKTFAVHQDRDERVPLQIVERPKQMDSPILEEFTAPDSKLEMMGPKKREMRTYDEAALAEADRDFSVVFETLKDQPEEIQQMMSGQRLLEEMERHKEEAEWLPKRIVALEREVKDLRDVLERLASNHVKLGVVLDFMKSLGSYYYTHCKYPDKEGFCTNWFWSKRPNFQALDGTRLPVKMGEDGRYYVRPSFVMCALCSATATKYWL